MKRLNEAVTFYLKNKTKYSIMITGEWGIGKTYYFKNVVKPMAEALPSILNPEENYKVVVVSLFGLKSINDIQSEIFSSIYPIVNNKYVKLAKGIGKSVLKMFAKQKGVDGLYDEASKMKLDTSDWVDLSHIVLCFDDLERMSPNLKIEEVIGYINNLVENDNVKVVIIANEPKIAESNYKLFKEKVIGNTIEFQPDFESSYLSLIKENFETFILYYQFLTVHKEFVIDSFRRGSINLRILEIALIYFHQIFAEVEKNLLPRDVLEEKKIEILLNYLGFTLAITTEYQLGNVNFQKREKLDLTDPYEVMGLSYVSKKSADKESKVPYRISFTDKYFKNEGYIYSKSVYDFITGGSSISYDQLEKELNTHYHVEDNTISEEQRLYQELVHYDNVWKLSDDEYKSKVRELLSFSDEGVYGIPSYPTIFWCAAQFNNPLRFNLDKLELRVIKGMKKAISHSKFEPTLASYLSLDTSSPVVEHIKRIRTVALDLNQKLRSKELSAEYDEIEQLFYKDYSAFSAKYYDREQHFRDRPLLREFNPSEFYAFFIRSDNSMRREITHLFYSRYDKEHFGGFKEELKFLLPLHEKIRHKVAGIKNQGITGFILHDFERCLNTAIKNISAEQP